jgi:hypothetical protein
MQTNPEDKYEVKKFCFVWLAQKKKGAVVVIFHSPKE